jgi:hypothetical protein
MDNKTKYIVLSLSLLLFLVAMMIWYSNSHSTFRPTESDFSVRRGLDISSIEIVNMATEGTILLTHGNDGMWYLNNSLLANESAVIQLLDILRKLTIRQPVSLDQTEEVYQKFDESGIRVVVSAKDHYLKIGGRQFFPYQRVVQSFMIAGDTPDELSSYMRKSRESMAFMVHVPGMESGLYRYFDTNPNDWGDPVIIDMARNEIERVLIVFSEKPEESFLLKQDPYGMFEFYNHISGELLSGINIDTTRVVRFLSSFHSLHYESLVSDDEIQSLEEMMFDEPFMTLTVKPFHNESTVIEVYRKVPSDELISVGITTSYDPNRFYLKSDDEYAIAQYYVFNRILRPLSFFVME